MSENNLGSTDKERTVFGLNDLREAITSLGGFAECGRNNLVYRAPVSTVEPFESANDYVAVRRPILGEALGGVLPWLPRGSRR